MSKQKMILILVGILLLCCLPVLYYSWIQFEVIAAYKGQLSKLDFFIEWLYPRFYTEQHRFDLDFFLARTAQVVWRITVLGILALMAVFVLGKPALKDRLDSFWLKPESYFNLRVYSFVCYAAILYYMFDFYWDYQHLYNAKSFYRPVPLLRIFHVPLVSPSLVTVLCLVFAMACLCSAMSLFPTASTSVVLVLFVLFQGWNYSFGKTNHGLALLTYTCMLMPLQWSLFKKGKAVGWPVQLIRVAVASCYLMAGLEKLLISGTNWVSAITFKAYLLEHPTNLGLWVSENDLFCVVLPAIALVIQLGFAVILFKPNWTPFILISGILFHWGTVALFDISSYFHPWIVVYVFFIDWEKAFLYVRIPIRKEA